MSTFAKGFDSGDDEIPKQIVTSDGVELNRIGKLAVYEARFGGKSIGTINAHKPNKIHAIDDSSRVHYADTIEACAVWLKGRAS